MHALEVSAPLPVSCKHRSTPLARLPNTHYPLLRSCPQKHLKALAGYGEDHMLVKKAHSLYEEAQAGSTTS